MIRSVPKSTVYTPENHCLRRGVKVPGCTTPEALDRQYAIQHVLCIVVSFLLKFLCAQFLSASFLAGMSSG